MRTQARRHVRTRSTRRVIIVRTDSVYIFVDCQLACHKEAQRDSIDASQARLEKEQQNTHAQELALKQECLMAHEQCRMCDVYRMMHGDRPGTLALQINTADAYGLATKGCVTCGCERQIAAQHVGAPHPEF